MKPGLQTLVMAGCCLFAESGVSCRGGVLELCDSLLFRPVLLNGISQAVSGSYGRRLWPVWVAYLKKGMEFLDLPPICGPSVQLADQD